MQARGGIDVCIKGIISVFDLRPLVEVPDQLRLAHAPGRGEKYVRLVRDRPDQPVRLRLPVAERLGRDDAGDIERIPHLFFAKIRVLTVLYKSYNRNSIINMKSERDSGSSSE